MLLDDDSHHPSLMAVLGVDNEKGSTKPSKRVGGK